jgi:pimeloyl-ACP methyl ester carboxylesterase
MPTAVRMSETQSRDIVANIECPVRVIYADPPQSYFPDALRRERAGLLRHGELIVLPGSHHLHMDDAVGTAAAIGDFFSA